MLLKTQSRIWSTENKAGEILYPGAYLNANGICSFRVWSPTAARIELKIFGENEYKMDMQRNDEHYWVVQAKDIAPGTRYMYIIDGEKSRPDPASFFQPEGVHGYSEIISHSTFQWNDNMWKGVLIKEAVIYELHIGTFTKNGTFISAIEKLDNLAELGITLIEIMPISQFPGTRNWGYDGVFPYAPANCYGKPDDLKTLIQECHKRNMGVILDVVYNHFGPEGNYLNDFGPYFTDNYKTPWGPAINYDKAYSDQVREYIIQNSLYWFKEYHIDGLRLDAIHEIYDFSASHILCDLNKAVINLNNSDHKNRFIIAESDLNDVRVISDFNAGGYNCTAQWSDDFHHALHSLLTNERTGYYKDFGTIRHLEKALRNTFVYNGNYSLYRCRKHGNDATDYNPEQFVIFTQNHDQVGNRAFGDRLSILLPTEALKLAASALLLSPYIPLIFMGEEYAETAPFQYFVEHGDADLIESVRQGRKKEFAAFRWKGEIPDPQSQNTFLNSKLKWNYDKDEKQKSIRKFYKTLLLLRKQIPALNHKSKNQMEIQCSDSDIMTIRRWNSNNSVLIVLNLRPEENDFHINELEGTWKKILDSRYETIEPNSIISGETDKIRLGKYCVLILEKEQQ